MAHVLFSKEEGLSGDGKRKRRAGLRKALQGAGSQALSFPGGTSPDRGLTPGFCRSSAGGSVLACLTSHLRLSHLTVIQLSAEWVKTPSIIEGNDESGGSPSSLLGGEGFSSGLPVFQPGVWGRAQNWHPTENMSSVTLSLTSVPTSLCM